MKGLLLKDWYALWSYLRMFLILDAVMLISPIFTDAGGLLLFYPCILSGMLSMTLIAYEEREHWNIYAQTLPYSKAQLVSSKYLISLGIGVITVVIASVSTCISMAVHGVVDFDQIFSLVTMLIPLSLTPASLLLPFIYKFGAEKGRIMYYFVIGAFFAVFSLLGAFEGEGLTLPRGTVMNGLLCLTSAALYAVSWLLSIRFYEKREL